VESNSEVQKYSGLLCRNVKVKIYKTTILPVILYGCKTWSLTLREEYRLRLFEDRVLRRIFGSNRDEVTGEWRKLHMRSFIFCIHPQILLGRSYKANEVGGTCGTHGRGEESVQDFGEKARRKETILKTKV
jgi:hypothetical protein